MQQVTSIAQALSDESRVRALLALREGELCVCQLIALLGLAPSTVSKHMSVLMAAGLIARRKEGRWHYYRLARSTGASPEAGALRWVIGALKDSPALAADASALCCIRDQPLEEAAACYTA